LLAELDKVVSLSDEGNDKKFENSVAFVRAAALDKAGRYAEAWQQVDAANRTVAIDMRDELKERRESEQESFVRLREAQITARGNQKLDSTHPVSLFILGPSRSGKTTMEQLVATLDGVKRGYENPSVDNAVRRAMQAAGLLTSSHFEHLPAQLEPSCREIYREELSRRAGSAKVFTNTHPARIHDAIRMVDTFPNVRFIFIKRKMEDILFRIYQRQYTKGNAYAYDLKEARDHIIRYHQMIDLLTDKLQDIVRIIHYEDMVVDPARALRTAADLCGLPVQEVPLPALGDDRGCAEPYRQFMAPALEV
jgi:hypothetical protein